MRAAIRRQIEEALDHISEGKVSDGTMPSLLIAIREHTTSGGMLRDLCDTVAHDERDRGPTRRYLLELVQQVRRSVTEVGYYPPMTIAFPLAELLEELHSTLVRLDIPSDINMLIRRFWLIANRLARMLDGVEFRTSEPDVTIRFEREKNQPSCHMVFDSLGGGSKPITVVTSLLVPLGEYERVSRTSLTSI